MTDLNKPARRNNTPLPKIISPHAWRVERLMRRYRLSEAMARRIAELHWVETNGGRRA